MATDFPPELWFLEGAVGPEDRRAGYSAFVARYTRLLLRTAREFGGDYDARMDRYRYLLDALQADDYRRLHAYRSVGGSSMTAWLLVVARRLCLDFERQRNGRPRTRDPSASVQAERRLRRALQEDGTAAFDPAGRLPDRSTGPDRSVRAHELREALDRALKRLTPRQQLALCLRYEDGRSVTEISSILGVQNVFQVYRLLREALRDARRFLEQDGVTDAAP